MDEISEKVSREEKVMFSITVKKRWHLRIIETSEDLSEGKSSRYV